MLLFGDKVTYASHLPMFHSPHDYQVLLKLRLADKPGANTVALYEEAKKSSTGYFTLVPEPMDLTQIISGSRKTFFAAIYVGHFERGGKALGAVQVSVAEVTYVDKLNGEKLPDGNRYMVFGEAGEYFAMHLIMGRPNFDAIVKTSQAFQLKDDTCRGRACLAPVKALVPDSSLPLVVAGSPSLKPPKLDDALGELGGIIADITKVIYVEEAELSRD
jgi:hypothetical protein